MEVFAVCWSVSISVSVPDPYKPVMRKVKSLTLHSCDLIWVSLKDFSIPVACDDIMRVLRRKIYDEDIKASTGEF